MQITCVHQGYEMYGSDRSFAESVAALRAAFPAADIEVVLPRSGPIVQLLEPLASRLTFEPLWVLRRQGLFGLVTKGLVQLVPALFRAFRRLRRSDLVYINTSVVFDYALAARFFTGKTLLHIHEIPEGFARHILRFLALWSGAEIIFNSNATRDAFNLPAGRKTHVVYNGIADPGAPEALSYDGSRRLKVLMLGRINRIKGQEILLQALETMPEALRRQIEVRIVGSAFESEEQERALPALVASMQLSDTVTVEPFAPDPTSLYRWADIVAVPSRRPESLGRVAIEAMAFGRPPVVSAIGGLTEVVEDGRTGWLVPPGDPAALAVRLASIIEEPAAWRSFPAAARARYQAIFSETAAAEAISAIAGAKLKPSAPAAIARMSHARS
jgi:glycosyltransferase involved in cell wall biosynthesis